MNIKRALAAAALAFAGSASAAPTTFAGHHFAYFEMSRAAPSLTFASQARQNVYNHDIDVRYGEFGNEGHGNQSLHSIYSVPDSKWKRPDGYNVPPVPEPETYALVLAGLLVVFMMARRRRART